VYSLKFDPAGNKWRSKILYLFCFACGDAKNPYGGLVMDPAGNLYGTSGANGGGYLAGIVFELKP
jgi:hypothetical protein